MSSLYHKLYNQVHGLTEEKYIIPLANKDDVETFHTSLNKNDVLGAIDIISRYIDDVPIAGGDEGSIKIRINTSAISDDIKDKITTEIKKKYPNLKYSVGQGSLSRKVGGIDWTTESMETCQCLGAFIDAKSLLNEFGSSDPSKLDMLSKKWKKIVFDALDNGEDWDSKGSRQVRTILNSGMTLDRWIDIGTLAAGMQIFINDVATWKTIHIIHGSIKSYYAAEESNQTILGTKANTADMIVSSVPSKELIKLISTEKAEFDNNGICKIGNVPFLQVSLKKGVGGAQLGKITSNIKDKYNISDYSTILHNVIGEGFIQYQLDEGIFSKAMSKIKGVTQASIGIFTNFFKKMFNFASSFLRGTSKQYEKQLVKDLALFKGIREDTLTESNINVILKNLSPQDVDKLLKGIQQRTDDLIRTTKGLHYVSSNLTKSKVNVTNIQQDDKLKLFANYTTLSVINTMLSTSAGTAKNLSKDLVGLSKEMLFGKTQLPVYKVYGGIKKPYEFLGSGKTFMDKNNNFSEETILMGIRMDLPKDSDKYYVIYSSFVLGVDEQGNPKYAENRMGTNRAGVFSYVIEGTKELTLNEFLSKYK